MRRKAQKRYAAICWSKLLPAAFLVCLLTCSAALADKTIDEAKRLIRDDDPSAALDLMKTKTEKEPDNAEAWTLLGVAYDNLWLSDSAAAAYKKALALNPKDDLAWSRIGQSLMMTDPKSAIQDVEKAASLNPHNSEYWSVLSTLYYLQKDLDKASNAGRKAIALNESDGDAWRTLMDCSLQVNDVKTAHDAAKHLILIDPNGDAAWSSYMLVLVKMGRSTEAKKASDYLIKLMQAASKAGTDRSITRTTGSGKLEDVLDTAWVCKESDVKQSRKLITEYIKLHPGEEQEVKRAWEAVKLKNSVGSLRFLAQLEPQDSEVWQKLGIALQCAGDIEEANAALAKAAKLR